MLHIVRVYFTTFRMVCTILYFRNRGKIMSISAIEWCSKSIHIHFRAILHCCHHRNYSWWAHRVRSFVQSQIFFAKLLPGQYTRGERWRKRVQIKNTEKSTRAQILTFLLLRVLHTTIANKICPAPAIIIPEPIILNIKLVPSSIGCLALPRFFQSFVFGRKKYR